LVKDKNIKKDSLSKSTIVTWTVFLFSMSIVLISFISVLFPALILASDTVTIPGIKPVTPDLFETGAWAGSVILANIMIFLITILHFKNKLPCGISKLFEKLFRFEISRKVAFFTVMIILSIYTIGTSFELTTDEKFEDLIPVEKKLTEAIRDNRSTIEDAIRNSNYSVVEPHVTYSLLIISEKVFGNFKVIPFLASITLLIVTYFITKTIANKRFAGIVAMIILIQSNLFLTYDTSITYTNFWILFYLISLYMIYKLWPLSSVSYILSIFSKALTITFLPMSLYFILRSNISRKQKMITAGITAGIILAGVIAVAGSSSSTQNIEEKFDAKEFKMGFTSFAYQVRSDGLVILFMIPLIIGLFIVSRNGVKHGESMMVFIAGILLIAPILTGFTSQTNQPYRFIPLVVFFATGVGILLSKRQT